MSRKRYDLMTDEQIKSNPKLKEAAQRLLANVNRALLATYPCSDGFLNIGVGFQAYKGISPTLRESIICRVGAKTQAQYELFQHEPLAMHLGVTKADMDAIKNGTPEQLSTPELQVAIRYVDECLGQMRASDAVFTEMKNTFNPEQISVITILIGHYKATAMLLRNLDVPLDEKSVDWSTVK